MLVNFIIQNHDRLTQEPSRPCYLTIFITTHIGAKSCVNGSFLDLNMSNNSENIFQNGTDISKKKKNHVFFRCDNFEKIDIF